MVVFIMHLKYLLEDNYDVAEVFADSNVVWHL